MKSDGRRNYPAAFFVKLRSTDILLGYCSTAYVTVCPVSPGIIGAIGCGIAVLSDAFGCTSAPFAARKDGRMFAFLHFRISLSTNPVRHFECRQLIQETARNLFIQAVHIKQKFINSYPINAVIIVESSHIIA